MTKADQLLSDLVAALDGAFISSWQSTAAWKEQLDAARDYLNNCTCPASQMPFGRCCKVRAKEPT